MNFTREPVIETVITPREGCKIVVRSSKGNNQEDYYVDAVEVVSFGQAIFFRSLEKPKPFMVPVSDYEILELRETRMVLKNATPEKSIKIGGGKEISPKMAKESPVEDREGSSEEGSVTSDKTSDRKRERRRRGRRGRDRNVQEKPMTSSEEILAEGPELSEEMSPVEETKAPSFISKLFPPPPTLIKETLGRYKTVESVEGEPFPQVEPQIEDYPQDTLYEAEIPSDETPKSSDINETDREEGSV